MRHEMSDTEFKQKQANILHQMEQLRIKQSASPIHPLIIEFSQLVKAKVNVHFTFL